MLRRGAGDFGIVIAGDGLADHNALTAEMTAAIDQRVKAAAAE